MRELGRRAEASASVYFTGGATAVLYGWRDTTVDVDLRVEPDRDEIFRALVDLKESLELNIELASPEDFVPVAPDWRDRSPFIEMHDRISFHHFDPRAQALSKIERHHAQDVQDIEAMLEHGLVDAAGMIRYFEIIAPRLFRYPSVDAKSLRARVEELFGGQGSR